MSTLNVIYRIASDISGLEQGVTRAAGTMERLESTGSKVASALAAAFSFQQLAGAASAVTEYAGHIDDLTKKTGLAAEAVQELDFAAKQNGLSFDTVSGALARMSNNIVEGGKGAVAAFTEIGLSVDNLKAMQPDQAFEAIAAGIAAIPDPMERSKVAMDIFGRSGADLLPLLTANIAELRDRARETGAVMSDELVQAGDRVGDTWDEMQGRLNNLKAQALLPVLNLFTELPAPMQTVVGLGLSLAPSLGGIGTAILAAGGPVAAMSALSGMFTAILPFLGPVGLIAAGVAAVVLAWKNWDKITGFVKGVYEAVKTWMVDKFNAIVESVKAKVAAVTGFFADMYDKVVGNSYVPDMVTGIGTEFGKLDGVMVSPTRLAVQSIDDLFGGLLSRADGWLRQFTGNVGQTFAGLFGGDKGGGLLSSLVSQGISALSGILLPGFSSLMASVGGIVWDGLKKVGGFFKDLFGGPNADELAGRDVVAAFERNLSTMLTDAQRIEAGNDAWRQTVIVLRDAYLAMGLTEQQALRDAERLWASSRSGADAARRVVDELRSRIEGGITVPVIFDVADLNLPPVVPMAAGGVGTVTRPTLFLAGEAGREQFAFSGAHQTFGDRAAGGFTGEPGVLAAINALRSDLSSRLPTAIGLAVRDQVLQRSRQR